MPANQQLEDLLHDPVIADDADKVALIQAFMKALKRMRPAKIEQLLNDPSATLTFSELPLFHRPATPVSITIKQPQQTP